MKTLLAFILLVTSVASTAAATVTGSIYSATGSTADGQILFRPLRPYVRGTNYVTGVDRIVRTTNGVFSLTLLANDYRMIINGRSAEQIDISVPDTTSTYNFVDLITNDVVYIYLGPTLPIGLLPSGINTTNLADGSVDNTELQYIDGLTGPVQDQLDALAGADHEHVIADVTDLQAALDAKSDINHVHAITSVTDLQSTLASKAATNHVHAAADLTSGVLDADRLPVNSALNPGILPATGGKPLAFLMTDESGDPDYRSLSNATVQVGTVIAGQLQAPELGAKADLSGADFTGPIATPRLITPSVRITRRADYTHIAETPVALDLSTNTIQKLVAVGNLTLTLANHIAGATYDVRITNSTASAITVTLADIQWESFWPGSIAGNKVGRIWLECDADAPTTVYGTYAETP